MIFRELVENYCTMYLNSEEGQKVILLSMAGILNNGNLDTIDKLLSNTNKYKWQLRDIKYISEKVKEIIEAKLFISVENCKVLCKAIIEISQLVNAFRKKSIVGTDAENRINKIYEAFLSLGVERRKISREEFLELADIEDEPIGFANSLHIPTERNEESRLVKYGYSVAQNSRLSNAARQDLLRRIIDSKEVSKGYIVSYLKHNIAINGKKESNYLALQKWQSDLEYVLKL